MSMQLKSVGSNVDLDPINFHLLQNIFLRVPQGGKYKVCYNFMIEFYFWMNYTFDITLTPFIKSDALSGSLAKKKKEHFTNIRTPKRMKD